jgi:hypothetical protein
MLARLNHVSAASVSLAAALALCGLPAQAQSAKPAAKTGTTAATTSRAAARPAAVTPAVPPLAVIAPTEQDVGSIDGIVAALYDIISGPASKPRDWSRLQTLFPADGRLIYNRASAGYAGIGQSMTVAQYANLVTVPLRGQGFFEKEIARSTNRFGQIAQVFSTYEARMAPEDVKPYERGINSVQLFNDGSRWWVTSMTWQDETAANPLPPHYLKNNY